MSDLKPCPFCGSKEINVYLGMVECVPCGAVGPESPQQTNIHKEKQKAIELWNNRAEVDSE